MTIILGVDPGTSGAVALLDGWNLRHLSDIPSTKTKGSRRIVQTAALAHLLRSWGPVDVAIIERVASMPGQGVASMFAFGKACGIVEGILAAMDVPIEYLTPGVWRKVVGLTGTRDVIKDRARHLAAEKWPPSAHHFTRKKDADRAEAALLALAGMRLRNGG